MRQFAFQAQFVLSFAYAAGAESAPSHQKHKRFAAAVSSPKTAQRPPQTAPPNRPHNRLIWVLIHKSFFWRRCNPYPLMNIQPFQGSIRLAYQLKQRGMFTQSLTQMPESPGSNKGWLDQTRNPRGRSIDLTGEEKRQVEDFHIYRYPNPRVCQRAR